MTAPQRIRSYRVLAEHRAGRCGRASHRYLCGKNFAGSRDTTRGFRSKVCSRWRSRRTVGARTERYERLLSSARRNRRRYQSRRMVQHARPRTPRKWISFYRWPQQRIDHPLRRKCLPRRSRSRIECASRCRALRGASVRTVEGTQGGEEVVAFVQLSPPRQLLKRNCRNTQRSISRPTSGRHKFCLCHPCR